ncbi:uncharacterized protein BDR25DRAFT_106837 [Lindgomyces ingoldianus]|uniref:Uncharacterized protein n=1 Tax=Lindgomyces ingoldianus TaxID=673940 RepID=A0ACB6QA02_9PLEO|nr:uncharacterized protein BDR25DRAFT_106837 [Lindgomyces ingoldianus]KAF2463741.1 hypothetical protein BDR25DRAFT_106837 [Lindgomyces ingoldianus]
MPLCTLHLLSLHSTTPNPIPTFLSALQSSNISPLVISRVIRWIILPSKLSTDILLAQNIHWDILLIIPSTNPLPSSLQKLVQHHWSVTAGIPSRLLQDFAGKNKKLLHADPASAPKLSSALENTPTADSAQALELSQDLQSWIQRFSSEGGIEGRGPVSMLNLLSFNPGMKDSYLQYGKAFAESIGSKRGGNAKIVGSVVEVNGKKKMQGGGWGGGVGREELWDEVTLAHYPSIWHFADMLASTDYQDVNKKFRVPALRDTFILCTSEIGVEEMGVGLGRFGGKL